MKPFVVLDYETRSKVDVKIVGAWEYSKHPSTEVLCLGYQIDNNKAEIWFPHTGPMPYNLVAALRSQADIVAHNSLFEKAITRNCLFKKYARLIPRDLFLSLSLHDKRWVCTASRARAMSLPGKLEDLLIGLKAPYKKDMEGHRLMLKMCKPRKATKHDDSEWHDKPEQLERLGVYCLGDVRGEAWAHKNLLPLTPDQREVWRLDQRINTRGLYVDLPAVKSALKMINQETERLTSEVLALTSGRIQSTNQRDEVLKFIRRKGFDLPNMQAKTINDLLKGKTIHGTSKRLLEIRQALSKTSTGKYEAFLQRTGSDQYIRDYLIYHGAGPGRWSGSGIQPQNFPTGRKNLVKLKDHSLALDTLKTNDIELMRLLYGDVLSVLSTLLRGMVIAPPNEQLFVADYAQIEARIVFWLAGEESGIKAFAQGRDLYREQAVAIYNLEKPEDATDDERDIGKRSILGCGFGMGWKKFQQNAWDVGDVRVPDDIAQRAVKTYRGKFKKVVAFWYDLEDAAVRCVSSGRDQRVGKIKFKKANGCLFMYLPSGRPITYYNPTVEKKETPWGEKKRQLHYWSVHPKTKKFSKESSYGGKLCENAVQGTAADIMINGMFVTEDLGYKSRLTVHDELITSRTMGEGGLDEFLEAVVAIPEWAKGCPIKAEGWSDFRYRK